jgi:glycosyltransferase involved in cell wall biosynthesis
MKILCICYEYPPIGGGGAPACQGVCESLVRQGHQVDVVTSAMRDLSDFEVRRGVQLYRVPCVRRHRHYCNTFELLTGLVPAYRAAIKLTREKQYDLIHCHFVVPSGLVARAVARKTGLPYIITAHGSDVPGYNPDRFNIVHRLISPTWRSILEEAKIVSTPSNYLRDLLQARADVPVEVIPYGFTSPPDPGIERMDRVLVVTRMFQRKGVQHVIDAMRDIKTHWRLCIVGDGPYLPTLKAHAVAAGVDAEFLGYVQGPELVKLYHSAKVFALPSSSDNFPVVLLEAMAAGCAVVTTAGTGCAEVVGDAAITVELGNQQQLNASLHHLLSHPDEVERLSGLARQRVQRFHWDHIGREYDRLYDLALSRSDVTPVKQGGVVLKSGKMAKLDPLKPVTLPLLSATPRVTVLMANYNYERFVGLAIRSMFSQTYQNWELLVCDDGSTDGSMAAIRVAAGDDPRIRVFEKTNGGQASAWNMLWPHARGEVICLLDSDDIYEPDKLATVVQAFQRKQDAGLLVHRLQVISHEGEPLQIIPFMTRMEEGWIADRLIRRGGRWRFMPTSGLCVRREIAAALFPMNPVLFGPWADSLLFFAGPLMTPVLSLDQPLARYRAHESNQSGTFCFTARAVWHDLHSIRMAIKGTNDSLEALGLGRRLDVRRHLEFHTMAFVLARLWGRPGGVCAYLSLMRVILKDDLYGWRQKLLATVVFGMLLILPRQARGPWLGKTLGLSRIKRWLQGVTRSLSRAFHVRRSTQGSGVPISR